MQAVSPEQLFLHITKEAQINAPVSIAWEALLHQIGPGLVQLDGTPMPLVLEAWPGGRYFRDLGNKAGHFWGHVQVIKPPTLLEIHGPLFMSYAAVSHVQYRLKEDGRGCKLTLIHRAIGEIQPDHREGVQKGWQEILNQIKKRAER